MEVKDMLRIILEQHAEYLKWLSEHPVLIESYDDSVSASEITIRIKLWEV